MDLQSEVAKTKQEILRFKTGQGTQGDSANYYCVAYTPGWFITNASAWREHTIKCIPYNNTKRAIFMPQLAASDWVFGGGNAIGRMLTYGQEIITWMQYGEPQSKMNNEAYAAGVPKGIVIFSNVDFYIETSYIEQSF